MGGHDGEAEEAHNVLDGLGSAEEDDLEQEVM